MLYTMNQQTKESWRPTDVTLTIGDYNNTGYELPATCQTYKPKVNKLHQGISSLKVQTELLNYYHGGKSETRMTASVLKQDPKAKHING